MSASAKIVQRPMALTSLKMAKGRFALSAALRSLEQ